MEKVSENHLSQLQVVVSVRLSHLFNHEFDSTEIFTSGLHAWLYDSMTTRKGGLATPTAMVPCFLVVAAFAQKSHSSAGREGSMVYVPEGSLGLSSNRVELASQKTAQSVMNLSDRPLVREFAQYPRGRPDGSMKVEPLEPVRADESIQGTDTNRAADDREVLPTSVGLMDRLLTRRFSGWIELFG